MTQQEILKQQAAEAALAYVKAGDVVGVGSGSTVHYFIDALSGLKGKIDGAVASSLETEKRLRALHIPIVDGNAVRELEVYIDGADEFNQHKYLIKGGGGALTREKIVAALAKKFVCIVDESKKVEVLGAFPLPIEVIPMARSYVAREIVKLGGDPVYRAGFTTDNGNVILDVHHLDLVDPIKVEEKINNIVGVVTNGLFAKRGADIVLMATTSGVKII